MVNSLVYQLDKPTKAGDAVNGRNWWLDGVGQRCLADVPSRDPLRDIAENFVRTAVCQASVLQGVDAQSITYTQQHNLVSHGDTGDSRNIHQRQVHRDAAQNRRVMVAHDHATPIRELPVVTISVADRK